MRMRFMINSFISVIFLTASIQCLFLIINLPSMESGGLRKQPRKLQRKDNFLIAPSWKADPGVYLQALNSTETKNVSVGNIEHIVSRERTIKDNSSKLIPQEVKDRNKTNVKDRNKSIAELKSYLSHSQITRPPKTPQPQARKEKPQIKDNRRQAPKVRQNRARQAVNITAIKRRTKQRKNLYEMPKYKNITEPPGSYHCQELHYAPKPMEVTALASYMGSGNTWLRHLIQEATGIYTGSLYQDPYLYRGGFPAEGQHTNKVIVTKIHGFTKELKTARKAILLIRNPFNAVLADFNRHNKESSNEHTGVASEKLFRNKDWPIHVNKATIFWYRLNKSWAEWNNPVLLINYDELKKDVSATMRKVFDFLKIEVKEEHFQCMLNNNEGNFHRVKRLNMTSLYNKEQVKHILNHVNKLNGILNKRFQTKIQVDNPLQ